MVLDREGEKFFRMVLLVREVRFQLIPNGIYYFDTVDRENIVLLINTVLENRKGFTQWEYEGPLEAQREMHLLGFPPEKSFGNMVRSNIIVNFPVTFDDVKSDKIIFCPNDISLKRKLVRRKPDSAVNNYGEIPR